MNHLLDNALLLVGRYLQKFSFSNDFWSNFELAFGKKFNQIEAEKIRREFVNGSFTLPIRVVPDQVLGVASGAYAPETNTVYLRESLVNSGDLNHISEVIIEEFGHSIDSQVNKEETPGDEGTIFRLLVKGVKLTAEMLAELRAEDDWAMISIDGQQLAVEMAVFNGTTGNDVLGGAVVNGVLDNIGDDIFYPLISTNDFIGTASPGQDIVNGGTGIDTLFVDHPGEGFPTTINLTFDSVTGNGTTVVAKSPGLRPSLQIVQRTSFTGIEKINIIGTPFLDVLNITSLNNTGSAIEIISDSSGQILLGGITYQGIETISIPGSNNNDYLNVSTTATNVNFSGGGGNDTIASGHGNDQIFGGTGNDVIYGTSDSSLDTFTGGEGDDIYGVYNSATVITEDASAISGNDTVWTAVNYALTANIENFYLVGDVNGTGNSSNNNIVGYGIGKNTINGGSGADSLTGGDGADIFAFQFGQSSNLAADKILDFAIGTDRIDILTLGGLAAAAPTSFSRARNNSSATTLQALAQAVYIDADGATNGNQALALGGAAIVVANRAAIAGTYLIVDDGVAGFSNNDLVVNITGYSGNLPALGAISVPSFFI
jgi:Ca2+-binding RTX toxin-like protein